jgi:mRNA interferase HigB
MSVRVIGLPIVDSFLQRHADLRQPFAAWLAEARAADWQTPAELKKRYPSASIMSGHRVVFNLKGNSYRLDCIIDYRRSIVRIVRLGTHAEYDHWRFDR